MNRTLLTRADHRLKLTFLASVFSMVTVSSLILASGQDRMMPAALTPLVAFLGLGPERLQKRLRLSVLMANLLGLTALCVAGQRFAGSNFQRLTAGTDLLIFLTWIVLLMPKSSRQYWWLIALSMLQCTATAVISTGLSYGLTTFLFALLMMWTLAVFSLARARQLVVPESAATTVDRGSPSNSVALWRRWRPSRRWILSFLGLASPTATPSAVSRLPKISVLHGTDYGSQQSWTGPRFAALVTGCWMLSIVVAMFVFAAFPRINVSASGVLSESFPDELGGLATTGYAGTVRLGEYGRLLPDNRRVMAFTITDIRTGKRLPVETLERELEMDEILLRGSAASFYTNGRWLPGPGNRSNGLPPQPFQRNAPADFVLEFTHDPPVPPSAFAPFPMTSIEPAAGRQINERNWNNSLNWNITDAESPTESCSWKVRCVSRLRHPEIGFPWWTPDYNRAEMRSGTQQRSLQLRASASYITDDLRNRLPRLYETARQLRRKGDQKLTDRQYVDRILAYLSTANGFRYSLDRPSVSLDLDPIEQFLFESRMGHCEYFASACVLLLQAAEIPARLVMGYSGCELNPATDQYEVRSRHAHAWVEVWLSGTWVTLDPTPGSQRQAEREAVADRSVLSSFQAALSDLWTGNVSSMSAERQKQFFSPLLSSWTSIISSLRSEGMVPVLQNAVRTSFAAPKTWRDWKIIVPAALLLAGGGYWAQRRWHVFQRLLAGIPLLRQLGGTRPRPSAVAFYETFASLCQREGLNRVESMTAIEFCRLAELTFTRQLMQAEASDLPARIARSFNQLRFGGIQPEHHEASRISTELQAFDAALRSAAGQGRAPDTA
ncbi:MAG: DUF3488 and transglutaminase-like domain-containing protein [Planctomyces sp.]|jgi:hypothetical protein|nr:DUF3488 and transglutaminase-like domain-containing protein [Planctomyces sp.]